MYRIRSQDSHPALAPLVIGDELLSVACLPTQGFTIVSLRDRVSGAEALWTRAEHLPAPCGRALGPAGAASVETFLDAWVGGWFELLPEVGFPADDDGASLLHGEVVRLPWDVVAHTPMALEARVRLVRRPLELTRRMEVAGGELRLAEQVRHIGAHEPVELAWGHHPCFARATFAGGRVELPVRRAHVPQPLDAANALARQGPVARWPHGARCDGTPLDLAAIPAEPDGRFDHVCIELADGWARLTAPRHDRALRLRFEHKRYAYVLLWSNYGTPGGWPLWGEGDTLAVELASVPGRTTPEARAAGALTRLAAGNSLESELAIAWEPLGASA